MESKVEVASPPTLQQNDDATDVMNKYRKFKNFDIADDYSDHSYADKKSIKQPQKDWIKKIEQEWRYLRKGLPDTIYVRVYEQRMDLLRAVIKGPEGTPYHDGLFFFDVYFPENYPNEPPKVNYHSGGLRLNPNLYASGFVCLSLLNTWRGTTDEKWRPSVSTTLQILVSIQGLILNAKPYFNEPGYEVSIGSVSGENKSLIYNESTIVLSLKTMVYTMKKPPKGFEDLVIGHFSERARDILTKCTTYYTEGIKLKGKGFKKNVKEYMKTLIEAFKQIGVENLDEFVPPSAPKDKNSKNLAQTIFKFFCIS